MCEGREIEGHNLGDDVIVCESGLDIAFNYTSSRPDGVARTVAFWAAITCS